MEIAQNSNLFEFIKYICLFDDTTCRYYFKSLIYIIQSLHEANYYFVNLLPENILFDKRFNVKICDYEIQTKRIYNLSNMASLLFFMKSGERLFKVPDESDANYQLLIINADFEKFWENQTNKFQSTQFSDDFKDLFNKLIQSSENYRFSFEQIMEHPYWYA